MESKIILLANICEIEKVINQQNRDSLYRVECKHLKCKVEIKNCLCIDSVSLKFKIAVQKQVKHSEGHDCRKNTLLLEKNKFRKRITLNVTPIFYDDFNSNIVWCDVWNFVLIIHIGSRSEVEVKFIQQKLLAAIEKCFYCFVSGQKNKLNFHKFFV